MAQFLKAKFLSEALKWKADPRHANDQFFAGLRYNPYIFAQARMVFPEYHKRFPYPADKEFVENFVRDLNNPTKNKEILKIINPEIITPELEAANQQFEVESRLEQQQVTQATGQIPPQPFSLSAAVTHSTTPRIIVTAAPPSAEEPAEIPAKTPTQTPSPPPPPKAQRPLFQAPRIPASFTNTVKNIGSGAGVFFKKNVSKYITAGRIATVVSGGIGAITGGALTNGSAIGMLGGAGLGAIAPSWIRSGEGTRFLGKVGNGAINFGINLSNQASGGMPKFPSSPGKKKLIWVLLGLFILATFSLAFTSQSPGPGPGPVPSPAPSGGEDISKCTFTRAGNPQLIKSSILSGWISSAAASAGIAPQVLASVAMHENQDFVANADNNHDAIKSNQFCNRGLQFCELNGQVLHSNPNADDPCTAGEIANGARTAQAVGLMQLLDIYNPGKDLCSITENLAIAAAKLKADGITAQPTQDQINQAIRQYYNSCTYGTYSYCDEVWQDYQNCKVQPVPTPGTDFASQLVEKIKNSLKCNGLVNKSNHDECIASIQIPPLPPLPPLSAQAIRNSVFNVEGGVLQCVGFVQAVATDLIGVGGHASDFASPNILGYNYFPRVGNQIQVGDLPVWKVAPGRPYGHIATVVSMGTNGAFQVAEANFCDQPCGRVDNLRYDSINDDQIAGWLRKK